RLEGEHDNLRAALAWTAQASDVDLMARLAGPLWRFWWMRGHFGEGRRWLERALERAAEPAVRLGALWGAGSLAFYQSDYPRARAAWSEALALGRAIDSQVTVAQMLGRLGFVAREFGDYEQGVRLCEESLELSRRLGDKESIAQSLMSRAQVALGQGDG